MSDRTGRTSIRARLGAALGTALLISSLAGWFVPVTAASALTITNSDSPDPVQSGSQILYTIVVTNPGGAKVDDIVLTDQINGVAGFGNPPLLDVVSTRGNCTQTNTQITCNAGSIEGRGTWTVTVRGVVTAAAGTTINNIATVVTSHSAQTYSTSAAATTQVEGSGPGGPSPDLTIGKNGPLVVTPGGTITYTLTVNNVGSANAVGVKVTDTLPAGVTITDVTATSLFSCPTPYTANTVTCTGGRVNAGSNATITVDGTVALPSGTLENTSVVDPDNTIDEGVLGNTADAAELNNFSNTVVTNVSPVPPPVTTAITLDKQGPPTAVPGQLIRYQLHVRNGSLGRADYITLTDGTQGLHAASLRVVSADASSGTTPICTVSAPTVKCTMTRLAVNGTLDVEIEGMVVASAGSTIINSAAVNANIKNTGYTARDEVQTIVNAAVDLTITKSDSPDPVCASSFPGSGTADCRGGLTYTFVVGNSGVNAASNVLVRDPLPDGTIFDDAASDDRCAVDSANVVTCTISSLAGRSVEEIRINVVAPPTLGTITNTVTVDPSNAIFEADETNNIAVASTTVATGIDLTILKEDEPGGNTPTDDLPGFDPIATSGTQTYTITVDNKGTQDATGIRVRDTLPAGTTFLSVTADDGFTCSQSGGIVECIGGSIHGTNWEIYQHDPDVEDHATIVIKAFARPTIGTMHNEVRVDPLNEIGEYDETNNIDFEDTTVEPANADEGAFHQLTIEKSQVSPAGAVATNGTLTYNLHVSNLGTDPINNVVVKDFLPAGTRFIQAKDTATGSAAFFCSHDGSSTGGTITCTGGDLSGTPHAIGAIPSARDIVVKVFAPNAPATITNLASVDPDHIVPEGNEFDNDSSVSTAVTIGGALPFNELTIRKEQTDPAGGAVATSSIVTYLVTVENTGTDPAFNIRLTDILPSGFSLISALDTSGPTDPFRFICTPGAGNTADCIGATLSGTVTAAPGDGVTPEPTSRTIEIKAFSSKTPGSYTNTAIVDPANAIPEGNETNNTANARTNVSNGGPGKYIDLHVKKTQTFPDPTTSATVVPGGQISYTLHVTNDGVQDAFNVTVRDVLPQFVTFHNARDLANTAGQFTCGTFGAIVTCTGGMIPTGGSRDIAVNVDVIGRIDNVASDQGDVHVLITNQAAVDPDNAIAEGDETNNGDFVDTTIQPALNLKLEKKGSETATQNDTTTYTITVTNEKKTTDGATAFGVKIVDPLPSGLIPLSITAEPGNFTCKLEENPVNFVTCVGDIEAGAHVDITIKAFVTQDGGTLDNEACVDPDHTVAETNELDNCKHAIGQVVLPTPDMLINKAADKSSVTPGEELTYTLTASNIGTGDSTATISVSDSVPSDVTVIDISPDAGWDCSASSGNSVTCERPDLAKGESSHIIVRTTVNSGVDSPIKNTANIIGGGESNAGNNTDSVTTSVGGAPIDLTIASITDTPDPVNARPSQLTYKIIAINNGTSAVSPNAVVRVELPDTGITVSGVSGSNGFNCAANTTVDASGMTFDCTGDFGASGSPSASTEITAIVSVTAGAPSDLVVRATVDPENKFGESDESNNSKSETTTVSGSVCTSSPCVDLVVADVFDSPDPATAPGTVTYVASIVNVGDAPVSPTAIWDIHFLYTGSGSVSLTAPTGVSCAPVLLDPDHIHCTSTSGTDGMDLGPGEGLKFTVTVTGVPAGTASLNVQADFPSGAITEFSESNNAVTETTTIVAP